MKNIFLIFIFPGILFSQINYSEHISPIIYNNCTECHRVGASGPMPFTNYNEVASLGMMIEYVTESGYMPPWHADTDYSNFLGERGLTDEEKQLISDWVDGGMLQGDPSLEAQIPEFAEGSAIGTPDLVLTMEEEYLIEGNNQDDYRVFVFETNFTEDQYLKSIEIIPGNLAAVHHVLVNIDTSGACSELDASTQEYGYECESGFCVGEIPQLSAGYAPGMLPPLWNNDIGLVLPAGADIAIQIHYAPSSIDEYDQSSVNLFFKDEPVEREVQVETIVDVSLQIPANQVYTHYQSYQIPFDMSLISILPHMHLIGKSWLVYAENNGDTIPIISIPDWDFNWQNFYQPEYMLKLPEGYTLHAYATYDNTASNPTNPNNPPQNMYWCDYTTCEMFFLPFSYVPYQEGDEDIYLGNPEDLGCTNQSSCNYNMDAVIDDGSCGMLDDCGVCHVPCCFDVSTSECDYSVSEQNCQNFWAGFDIISDPEQNIFWNTSCSFGCTDPQACNYDPAILPGGFDDGSCEYPEEFYDCDGNCLNDIDEDSVCDEFDDCIDVYQNGNCLDPDCFNNGGQIGFDGNCCCLSGDIDWNNLCINYYPTCDFGPDWILGCTDADACNYDPIATFDDGSCYNNDLGCGCDNPAADPGYDCDGNPLEDCLDLSILSIYQSSLNQFTVVADNSSFTSFFSYPGFILFNSFGDTIAVENVNFFGIAEQSIHVLEIQDNAVITPDVSLQLYTNFYDFLQCEWFDLTIVDQCELLPDPGPCDAAIQAFYFDSNTFACEEFMWGGCNGIVPFSTLEDCEAACGTVNILETGLEKNILIEFDVLGRNTSENNQFLIRVYDDGTVEKNMIFKK